MRRFAKRCKSRSKLIAGSRTPVQTLDLQPLSSQRPDSEFAPDVTPALIALCSLSASLDASMESLSNTLDRFSKTLDKASAALEKLDR
jgi:hypothetical protein